MDTITCRFCGDVMRQSKEGHICPNCKASFRQEADEIIWTFPEHPGDNVKELPIWNCFEEFSVEEIREFVEIGEAKIGERNISARLMLNRALEARGSKPVF